MKKIVSSLVAVLIICTMMPLGVNFVYADGLNSSDSGAFSISNNSGNYSVSLNKDATSELMLDSSWSGKDVYIHLNGHKWTVTGATYGNNFPESTIHILGDEAGGTIVFSNENKNKKMLTVYGGLEIDNVTFENCVGACLFDMEENRKEKPFTVKNCHFKDCDFYYYGGAFYFNQYGPRRLDFINDTFYNIKNTHGSHYGCSVIYFDDLYYNGLSVNRHAQVNMSGCIFDCCRTESYGGCIFINDPYVDIGNLDSPSTIDNYCINCAVSDNGGAIYDNGGLGLLTGFSFCYNTAKYGGAFCLNASGRTIENCDFIGNVAYGGYGGGIYGFGSEVTAYLKSSLFYQNRADVSGDDYYISWKSFENCLFSDSEWRSPDGSGTSNAPYRIKSARDMIYLERYSDENETATLEIATDNVFWGVPLTKFNGRINGIGRTLYVSNCDNADDLTVAKSGLVQYSDIVLASLSGKSKVYGKASAVVAGGLEYYAVSNGEYVKQAEEKYKVGISSNILKSGFYYIDRTQTQPDRLVADGDVSFILADGIELTLEKGIQVANGSRFSVYAQTPDEGAMGKLKVNGTDGNAAIGGSVGASIPDDEMVENGVRGGDGQTCGEVNIHSGIVTITARGGGAGIGGGTGGTGGANLTHDANTQGYNVPSAGYSGNGGNGGTVNLYGGVVTVNAYDGGAGIGGARGGNGKNLIDNSWEVIIAIRGGHGGVGGIAGTLNIYNSKVTVNAHSSSAAVGGGAGGRFGYSDGRATDCDVGTGANGGGGGTVNMIGGTLDITTDSRGVGIGGGAGGEGPINLCSCGNGSAINLHGGAMKITASNSGVPVYTNNKPGAVVIDGGVLTVSSANTVAFNCDKRTVEETFRIPANILVKVGDSIDNTHNADISEIKDAKSVCINTMRCSLNTLDGAGTEVEPYLISTAEHLAEFANLVAIGWNCKNEVYKLTNDITYNGQKIGTENNPFSGTFDGEGHTVNVQISSGSYTGLFASLDGANVKNLEIKGTVSGVGEGAGSVGAVTGYAYGGTVIDNCHVTADVNGTDGNIGGIAGAMNNSTITNCRMDGNVTNTGWTSTGGIVGGILGGGDIINCMHTGKIIADKAVGGILGCVMGGKTTIGNCSSVGSTAENTTGGGYEHGGIAGFIDSTVESFDIINCFSQCNIGVSKDSGYIIGNNQGVKVSAQSVFYVAKGNAEKVLGTGNKINNATIKSVRSINDTTAERTLNQNVDTYNDKGYAFSKWGKNNSGLFPISCAFGTNYTVSYASVFGEMNPITIIVIVAILFVAVAGVAVLYIVKKKKKPVLADGVENTDEE